MDKPLISIILPVYNIEDYLQKCMNSLYVQTYRNLEFVIVDDGSNDVCANMCDLMGFQDARVAVYHKKNGGLSDARNYGIRKARGEYITCVDPDDYVDKDYIEYLYNLVKNHNTLMSVCQHRVIFSKGKKDHGSNKEEEVLNAKECIKRMLYHDVIDTSAWAKLCHKSLYDHIEYPVGKNYEDIATTYKLFLKSKKIAVGYESKYNYVVRKTSIVNRNYSSKKLELMEMTDKMAEDVRLIFPDLQQAVECRQIYARFSTLNQMMGVKNISIQRNEILDYIDEHKKIVKTDKSLPNREKNAIRLLSFGYPVYRIAWSLYSKVTKK